MNSLSGNDHAAVSKFLTEGVHEWQEREGETDATCIAMAIDANTEATLALAFEQRTANLIAFYGDGGPGEAYDALHDLIVSRLGLGES